MTPSAGFSKTFWALAAVSLLLTTSGLAGAASAKPSIHNFLPRSGSAGATITITGKNFTGVSSVKIAGLRVAFSRKSATRITASVPASAKTGKVSVTTGAGTATSTGAFTFVPAAPNGSGTLTTSVTSVAPASTGDVVAFTYTAASGGMAAGAVTIAVPSGWSAPVTTNAAGCTTASTGTVTTSGQTITVSALTLSASGTATITYGATSGGACTSVDGATASSSSGVGTWQAQQKSTPAGTLTNLATSPTITVSSANGTGTLTTVITKVTHSETGDVIPFTFTAGAGGMTNGVVTIAVPSGWSAPVTTNTQGCTTSSAGTVAASGQTITVSGLTLAAGATATITYGATTGGSCTESDGATVGATTGTATFSTQEASTASGTLTAIAASPSLTVG